MVWHQCSLERRVKYRNERDIVGTFTAKYAIADHQMILLHEIERNTGYKGINVNAASWGKQLYMSRVNEVPHNMWALSSFTFSA